MNSMEPYAADDAKRKRRDGGFFGISLSLPGIKATIIVSTEGLPIVSAFPHEVDERRIAAMTASLLSLSKRAIIEMKKGDFDQLFIRGSDDYILLLPAGPNAALLVLVDNKIRLGLILLECRRACERIAQLI